MAQVRKCDKCGEIKEAHKVSIAIVKKPSEAESDKIMCAVKPYDAIRIFDLCNTCCGLLMAEYNVQWDETDKTKKESK